jgi:serine/threonine protein kinase
LEESEARDITLALSQALQYLHELGVMHRDVKPANVLFSSPASPDEGKGTWKLIDFSASKHAQLISSGEATLRERVGTPGYIAPEMLRGIEPYGPKADVFSLGCTVHALLTNMCLPRRHRSGGMVTKLPQRLSPQGHAFIDALLTINPADRPTIDMVLSHPWLSDRPAIDI